MADNFDNFDDDPDDDPFGYFQSDAYWLNNPYEFKKEFTENEIKETGLFYFDENKKKYVSRFNG